MKTSDLICLWCGKTTTSNKGTEGEEHIFPVAIGGFLTLPVGDVCKKCNSSFSSLDKHLKYGHVLMAYAYQKDPRIKGRNNGSKERRERQLKEKQIINCPETGGFQIERAGNTYSITNGSLEKGTDDFVRALHKCGLNILCSQYGSNFCRDNYPELIEFVKNDGVCHPWSFAVSFPLLDSLDIRPIPLTMFTASSDGNNLPVAASFIHTSGIWIVGLKPFMLREGLIEKMCEGIVNKSKQIKEIEAKFGKMVTELYGAKYLSSERTSIGKLNFIWTVENFKGEPNPKDCFYLLTRCKTCGQNNPTGIMLQKESIFNEFKGESISFTKRLNNWNVLSKEDLIKLGLKTDYLENPNEYFLLGADQKVHQMNISNCSTSCINCGSKIIFSAKDCFL